MPWSVDRVEPYDITLVWGDLLPQIRRGLRKGGGDTMSEPMLFHGVLRGNFQLWVIHDGDEVLAGLFFKTEHRERGIALIVLDVVAGSGKGFRNYATVMVPRIREFGRMIGAYTIEAVCRDGVARILADLGCKRKATIMELK